MTSTRPTAPSTLRMGAEANCHVSRPQTAGSTASGPSSYTRPIDRPEASVPVVVRLRSAVCLLGRFPALAGVDLDVAGGEIVLLSGANGAGKTTLLRLLAGLVPLYSGEATVLGHDLADDRRERSPRPRARRARDLLLRRPDRAREPAVRGAGRGTRHRRGRRRARAARARIAGRRRAPPPLGRAAPPPRGRGRAGA